LSNGFVVGFVEVLQNGRRAGFADDSGEQSVHVLGAVSGEEELVARLGGVGFGVLAHLPEHGREGFGVLLVGARRGLEAGVGRLEQVELHLGAEVSFVANDARSWCSGLKSFR